MGLDVKDAAFLQEIAHRTVAEVAELQSDFAQANRLATPVL